MDAPPLAARRRVARALEEAGASAAERATHWLGAGDVERARAALAEAAAASAARLRLPRRRRAVRARARSRRRRASRMRFELLERLAVCAELAGDLAGSARAWREVIDGRRGRGEVERVAEAQHAIGRVLALRGSTERALTAWSRRPTRSPPAAGARTRRARASRPPTCCSRPAACARRWPPSRRRSRTCRTTRRPSCRSRARSLEGIVLGKLGETREALASVRDALAEALAAGHTATAAAAYQALAVVYENAGELGGAAEAYEVAIDYCATTGVAGTGAVCSACLCHVLRQRGEWRRSLDAVPRRCSTIRRRRAQPRDRRAP